MSLWKIAWRSIQWRALASLLTVVSMALGVALVVTVLIMYSTISKSFNKGAQGFDLIVGPKGGRLELVLNTVYHLGTPIGKMPWSFYKEFKPGGKYGAQVAVAIPYCLGDNYEGYRVVGTVPELFEIEYAPGEKYAFAAGRNFQQEHFFNAVIGSQVAYHTGLRVGSPFEPTHGVSGDGHKHDAFHVVGILKPTGTPNDRAIFINIEGFYLIPDHAEEATEPKGATPDGAKPTSDAPPAKDVHKHDHAHDHHHDHAHHHDPLPEDQRAVSSILIRTKSPLFNPGIQRSVNNGLVAQAVYPASEIYTLFHGLVGQMRVILLCLAVLVVVVASIGVMVSIYNSMNDRRRELALMRSLGAGRATVMVIVLLESLLLSLGGGALGLALGHGLIGALNPLIEAQTGVTIGVWDFPMYDVMVSWLPAVSVPIELVLVPGLIVAAALAGLLPAIAAYQTDVAKTLAD